MTNSRLENLLKMLESQPEDPFLIYAIAIEYEAIGDNDLAGKYFSTVLRDHPDYLPVYYQAGLFFARTGNLKEGIRLLNEGINLALAQKEMKTLRELRQALEEAEDE